MKQLKLRVATPGDIRQIQEWSERNPLGKFDPDVLTYPTSRVVCAYDEDEGPICYLPTQKVLVLESVASNPAASRLDRAQALRDLVKAAELLASSDGCREIFLPDGAGGVSNLAENHGFRRLSYPVFRLKL